MEPRLVIFHHEEEIVHMFLCAEGDSITEIPTTTLSDGITYLMAAYYVYDISYPRVCNSSLFFFQDIVLDMADSLSRPVRYSTYLQSAALQL